MNLFTTEQFLEKIYWQIPAKIKTETITSID